MKTIRKMIFIIMSMVVGLTVVEAKLVDTTTKANLNNSVNLVFNSLYDTENKIYFNNMFNCSSTGCTLSSFNNLGLLSRYEYDVIGGNNSYLYNLTPYFIINNNDIEVLNGTDDDSHVRPTTYLVPDTKVTGAGTESNPWIIYEETYFNYNINVTGGSATPNTGKIIKGNTLTITLTPDSIHKLEGVTTTCNGDINGNILTISNVQDDVDCEVIFPIKTFYVSVSSSTGTVSPSSIYTSYGTSVRINLTPKTGYTLTGVISTCKNGTISGNVLTISNVTQNISCTVTFPRIYYTYRITAVGGSVSPGSGSVAYGTNKTFTLIPSDGYTIEGATTTCNGTISGSTLTINNILSNISCSVTFMESSPYKKGSLAAKILEDNPNVEQRTDVGEANISNTTGTIYKRSSTSTEQWTEDVDGDGIGEDVYYYSGNTTNNWVKFGGFYWRIIRINEDGSVRMLYLGTSHNTTKGYIGASAFNSSLGQSRYVGYMYGGTSSLADNRKNTTSSTAKTYIDKWYKNNLLTNYDKYISKTAIYCSDRSIWYGKWSNSGSFFGYAGQRRLNLDTPSYRCGSNTTGGLFESTQAIEDKFSASTVGGGNGQLKYPIALMTGDEVMYAGGVRMVSLDSPYAWYYTNSAGQNVAGYDGWWLMTPEAWQPESTYPYVHCVLASKAPARLILTVVTDDFLIRPVISLKYCTKYSSGNGTPTNPYQVSIDSTCASAVN